MIECYLEWILSIIPFYFELKIVLLAWLTFPIQTRIGVRKELFPATSFIMCWLFTLV